MSNWMAVYHTQGDGIIVRRGDEYFWKEPPKWMKSASPGDPIGAGWNIEGPFNSETGERLYDESDLIDYDDLERLD